MKAIAITCNLDGKLVALNEADEPTFARWKKELRELDPGEIKNIYPDATPNSALSAWHIILCKAVFAAQERFTDFRAFRQFLYTMAGHCVEIKIGRKVVRVPGSWSWDDLSNDYERSDVHNAVLMAMHDETVLRALWPHLRPAARTEMILTTIAEAEAKRQQHRAAKATRVAIRNAQSKAPQTETVGV